MDEKARKGLELFLDAASSQIELVSGFAGAVLAFAIFVILQAYGIRERVIDGALRAMPLLYSVVGAAVVAILLGFVALMASTGHYFEIGVNLEPLDQETARDVGQAVTEFASAQMLFAVVAIALMVVWVLLNRRRNSAG